MLPCTGNKLLSSKNFKYLYFAKCHAFADGVLQVKISLLWVFALVYYVINCPNLVLLCGLSLAEIMQTQSEILSVCNLSITTRKLPWCLTIAQFVLRHEDEDLSGGEVRMCT